MRHRVAIFVFGFVALNLATQACGFDGTGSLDATLGGDGGDGGAAAQDGGAMGPADAGEDADATPPGPDASTPCTTDAGGAGFLCSGQCVDITRNHENCGKCGTACAATSACEGTCVDVAGTISPLRYDFPCGASATATACNSGSTPPAAKSGMLAGTGGTTYVLAIRVRGVVEQKTYLTPVAGNAQGKGASFFITGGAPATDEWNAYSLAISSPAQTTYLNSGTSGNQYVNEVDYRADVRALAGSVLTLAASASTDMYIIKNVDMNGTPIGVASIPPGTPFNGQFLRVDVESVSVAP